MTPLCDFNHPDLHIKTDATMYVCNNNNDNDNNNNSLPADLLSLKCKKLKLTPPFALKGSCSHAHQHVYISWPDV